MSERFYLESHEWVTHADDIVTLGVSDFAQEQLNDIVFVELPEVGRTVEPGEAIAVLESCKTAADVYTPVEGEIVEVNELLTKSPETVNQSPLNDGWLIKIKTSGFDPGSNDKLQSEEKYSSYVAAL
jgi:glycine cleavage system H protein